MSNVKLNKASLSLEQRNLKNYRKYLPSLELKRKKLLAERGMADVELIRLKDKETELKNNIQANLPMVSECLNILHQLIHIKAIHIDDENIVGVKLPLFKSVEFSMDEYTFLNTPHWFENLIESVCGLLEARLMISTAISRLDLLAKAIQTVTQRKNLFEKVLIPGALKHIRLIRIFLADSERAAVISSKIAKRKRLQIS